MDRPIVVPDTGVVLQAALNPRGPAGQIIGAALDRGDFTLYLCPALRSEIEDVLLRPALRARFPQLTTERAAEIFAVLDAHAIYIPNPPRHFPLPRDIRDEPILNLAIEVRANFLVARDRDLLDLDTDPSLHTLSPLRIVTPDGFLQEMRAR